MAGALFPRIKTWSSTEDVVFSDLNAEFDNILNNLIPTMLDDYSVNVSQMQVTTDPGEVGSESLATTLAGELARLRLIIKEITGEDQWYESPVASLVGISNIIGTTGLTGNRLVSGRVRTPTSDQPVFLVPDGTARTVKLDGTPTNFKYYINGTEYTISSDVLLTNLTAAPSSNNTALINDTNASDQDFTKHAGEDGSEITIDTVGSEITALVGKFAAFKLDNGGEIEYFIAFVGTNKLTLAKRGFFFDSADAPMPRIVFSNNDTITLMKLSWIFAKTDGTLTVSYTNPVWSFDEPTSPATNDYWFDYSVNYWKRYDVSSFVSATATLVGLTFQNTTACLGGRSFEFFKTYEELNTIELIADTNSQVKSRWPGSVINVWGSSYKNEQSLHTWDMTLDLDSGVTETSSTFYYFYVTEDGDRKISNIRPYDRREDLLGWYHPHQSWRCVGFAFNNGSSNLTSVESYFNRYSNSLILPSQTTSYNIEVKDQIIPIDSTSGALTFFLPPAAYFRGQALTLTKTSSDVNAITIDGFGSETIDGLTTRKLATQYEVWKLVSDGSNWFSVEHRATTPWSTTPLFTVSSLGTTSNSSIWSRRAGDTMWVKGFITSGTVAATTFSVNLPTGYQLDPTKIVQSGFSQVVGSGYRVVSGGSIYPTTGGGPYPLFSDGSSATAIFLATSGSSQTAMSKGVGTAFFANGDSFTFEMGIPVSGWDA